jgi:exopolysaccharide biosynthesis WecB/TagA/CpsF family protein
MSSVAYRIESPVPDRVPAPRAQALVDGWGINVATLSDAVSAIIAAARDSQAFTVFTLNLDHLVKLRTSAAFRAAYASATFVTADGAPVARLARRQSPMIERTTGADLVLPLAAAAAKAKVPVYLFGTSPTALAEAGRELSDYCDGALAIAGSSAPPMNFDPNSVESDAEIDRIAATGARLCFVALGAPKQELFAARALARGVPVGFVCIGAGLDFLAGEQVRAPHFMQSTGLEWIWRLALNPRRLAARYASCAVLLAKIALIEPLFGSRNARPTA